MGNCLGSDQNKQTPSTGNLASGNLVARSTLPSKSESSLLSVESEHPDGNRSATIDLRTFSCQELKNATNNFNADYLLGKDGYGKVYKGLLRNKHPSKSNGSGLAVAIKKLTDDAECHGFETLQAEVNNLGKLSHPNLVKLLGYCWEDNELFFVYEFMERGSLKNHLFGRGSSVQPLPWGLRLKIMIGAARGFAFLHSSDHGIIHRDIKPSNILIDGSYNAKISDFSLVRSGPSEGESHVTTRVMGTYGYAAPEYVATGHLYIKSDVYSFGVVLSEILTGERAHDTKRPNGKYSLVDWSRPYLSNKRKLNNIMDKRLGGEYSPQAASATAKLALQCIPHDPKARPSMQEVLDTLIKIEAMDKKTQGTKKKLP